MKSELERKLDYMITRSKEVFGKHLFELEEKHLDDAEKFVFDSDKCRADYNVWCKMPSLTVEESAALLLEMNPDEINVSSMHGLKYYFPKAKKYFKLVDIISRFVDSGDLASPITPMKLTAWAIDMQECPNSLKKHIESQGHSIESLQHKCQIIESQLEQKTKELNQALLTKNYTTPLLELQNKAIQEFWLNHDPLKPPKQKFIVQWLRDEGAGSDSEAKAIDLIIRPPNQKTGGNKAQKKSTHS